jgi:hypothetical protein
MAKVGLELDKNQIRPELDQIRYLEIRFRINQMLLGTGNGSAQLVKQRNLWSRTKQKGRVLPFAFF